MAMDEETILRRRWWTLSILCLSLVMIIVGNTVLNVALPTLIRELHATNSELQWMVDAYGLVFAGLLLTCGAIGDRFGRKGTLQVGLIIFVSASVIAAFGDSPERIIVCRAIMGIGAALVMPATLSILTSVFPPHERARAIAIWAGLSGLGVAIGPVTGGWLLEHFWWGSVFLVNVPVVFIALVGGWVLVPTSRDPNRLPLDPIGALLSIVGLTALIYGIIEAPNYGWTDQLTLSSFAIAVLVLGIFCFWEWRTTHPMLDLRFFQNPRFTTAAMAITLVFFAMFGTFFVLTQYFQLVLGYSALGTGVRTAPMAVTLMTVAPMSARLVERIGPKAVVSMGLTTISVGLFLFSRAHVDTGYLYLIFTLVIIAAGMALTMAPSTASIMASLPLGKAGVGSAVNDTTRELGGALGVAILGSFLASQYKSSLHPAISHLPEHLQHLAGTSLGAGLGVAARAGASGKNIAAASKTSFVHGMNLATVIGGFVVLAAAGLVAKFLPAEPANHIGEGVATPVD